MWPAGCRRLSAKVLPCTSPDGVVALQRCTVRNLIAQNNATHCAGIGRKVKRSVDRQCIGNRRRDRHNGEKGRRLVVGHGISDVQGAGLRPMGV